METKLLQTAQSTYSVLGIKGHFVLSHGEIAELERES